MHTQEPRKSVRAHTVPPRATGFTLVEILCAIVVVAMLLAITFPLLSKARAMSVVSSCQANLRSCTQSVLLYSQDFRNAFPYLATANDSQRAFENGGIWLPFYSQAGHWPFAMRGYQGVGETLVHASQLCPGSDISREIRAGGFDEFVAQYPPETIAPSHYWMSYATLSDPSRWQPGVDPHDPVGFRAVRTDEVLFPATKSIMSEPIAYHLGPLDAPAAESTISLFSSNARRTRFHVAFADASTQSVAFSDFVTLPQSNALHTPTLATPDGIRGRDIR